MKKKKIFILIILIANFILIIYFIFIPKKYQNLAEDLFFLKTQSNRNKKEENKKIIKQINQYEIEIDFKNSKSQLIQLTDTIYHQQAEKQKIEPGVEGEFEIILKAKETSNYQLYFESKNEKPKNLNFQVKDCKKDEKLENIVLPLYGKLEKNERKSITIQWKWNYENGIEDVQDTKDAQKIRQYEFRIYVIGERREKV